MVAGLALPLVILSAGLPAQAAAPALRVTPALIQLRAASEGPAGVLNLDPRLHLAGLDDSDRPVYYESHTLIAARSIGVDQLWPGGASGLNMDGLGYAGLGMWDTGRPLTTHQEVTGRIDVMDDPASLTSHSTSVAGILIAQGVQESAKGMAPAARLKCWDWESDLDEVGDAAWVGLRVSNHSYGSSTGWNYSSPNWYWHGNPAISPVEDAAFGYYSGVSRQIDETAWLMNRLIMVRSAGNHRQDAGPAEGVPHFVFTGGQWVSSLAPRERDGGLSGYDSLGPEALAKNVLTVGAVNDLPNGWSQPADVVVTGYSSFGPTDDGRIKPDVVANGSSLQTMARTGPAAYTTFSGTSAASPTVAGALALLQKQYQDGHAQADGSPRAPLSSTLRGLLIHTANEAGEHPGPDYRMGWGLVNARAAADLVAADNLSRRRIVEGELGPGGAGRLIRTRAIGGPARATLCWVDPPATVLAPALDNPSARLIHDLNLTGMFTSGPYLRAWSLDPQLPDAPAQAAGNNRDNVERLDGDIESGRDCFLFIQPAASLPTAQSWSLLLSGLEPVAELIPVAGRSSLSLGDTLMVDVYLNGGLAVAGLSLRPGWPAGALRLVDAQAGPELGEDGRPVAVEVVEAGLQQARVDVGRTGDGRGLDFPSGLACRLAFVAQSLGEFALSLGESRIIGAGGELDHLLIAGQVLLNQGQDPADLQLVPEDLAPRH
jgi:subtilisin family serine protease